MDWADDVAYSVHDVEDAVHAGHLRLQALREPEERAEAARTDGQPLCPDAGVDELGEALDRLLALPAWPDSYDGSLRAAAALKDLTSELIGRFCLAAEEATRAAYGDRPLTRYSADVVVPRPTRLECEVLKAVADRYVMQPRLAGGVYETERAVVTELVQALARRAPAALEPWLRPWWEAAPDDAARWRVVIDQVASFTDTSAVEAHRRLVGID